MINIMKAIRWQVDIIAPPVTIRYCKKCGVKTEYVPSGLFRVNANQKSIDVWLIYRCHKCKTTWNSTILSRVNPKSIEESILEKFQNNDPDLALRYAMDMDILRRNGAKMQNPKYKIIGEDVNPAQSVQIKIFCAYPAKIKLSKILREKLSLSNKVFDEMVDNGVINLDNDMDIRKAKLLNECVVTISNCNQRLQTARTKDFLY